MTKTASEIAANAIARAVVSNIKSRPREAYETFRGGFRDMATAPPDWMDLEPRTRDAITVAWLQGKLDGGSDKRRIKALETLLRRAMPIVERAWASLSGGPKKSAALIILNEMRGIGKPWTEGEPEECDSGAWDRLPPVVRAGDPDMPELSLCSFEYLATELRKRGATVTPAPHGGDFASG